MLLIIAEIRSLAVHSCHLLSFPAQPNCEAKADTQFFTSAFFKLYILKERLVHIYNNIMAVIICTFIIQHISTGIGRKSQSALRFFLIQLYFGLCLKHLHHWSHLKESSFVFLPKNALIIDFYQLQLFCVSNFLISQHFVFICGQLLFSNASLE